MNEVTRLLRLRHVMEGTGLGRTTVLALVAQGRLPRPVAISDRAKGWIEQGIEAFLRSRIAASRGDAGNSGSPK